MKSVLISIQPKWCEKIASGKKIIEVRKNKPSINTPFKCYIYCTNQKTIGDFILCKSDENSTLFGYNSAVGVNKSVAKDGDIQLKGKVIGEFVCDVIFQIKVFENGTIQDYIRYHMEKSCVAYDELVEYIGKGKVGYGWGISDLVIYDEPKELSEFKTFCKSYYDGGKCDDCKYLIDGRGYEYDESDCGCNGLKPITRPPQSWGYVSEVGI
jgi:predicted transcriptional regulator